MDYVLRKTAHVFVYFILSFLAYKTFDDFLYSICFCIIFALSDEYHQTFVEGRSGVFTDVLYDTAGVYAFVGFNNLITKKQ